MALPVAIALAAAMLQPSAPDRVAEALHAIGQGRVAQARAMADDLGRAGTGGKAMQHLLGEIATHEARHDQALGHFESALAFDLADPVMAERAGLAALRAGDAARAARYLDRAAKAPAASWRTWNGLAVLADRDGDWDGADAAYAAAFALAPGSAELANNRGWSLMMRGRWADSIPLLERARALDPSLARAANNLELARIAASRNLPVRRPDEDAQAFAARLNDAGVVARMQGDEQRAVAAFARAIEVRTDWYRRAANNLSAAKAP